MAPRGRGQCKDNLPGTSREPLGVPDEHLELAAVRLRGRPVEEILERLTDRFTILGFARTAADRHRTLRAAISWSYELCNPAEQRLWAELSVFPGGFGLEAAEHVCGPGTFETLTTSGLPGGRPPTA